MDESPNLDPAALQRLRRLGDAAFVCKMIDLFLDYSARKLIEARTAQAAGNSRGVEQAVHPIKSSAGNVGACRVQELALRLELLAHQGQDQTLAASLTELEHAFAAVKPELEARKKALAAEAA